MIEALLHRLRENATLAALLGVTPGDSRIHPHSVAFPGPGLAYEYTDMTRGDVYGSQVTFRAVSADFDLTRAIAEKVTASLHVPPTGHGWWFDQTHILTCHLGGGGSLEMEDVGLYQRFVTFDVKWRQ